MTSRKDNLRKDQERYEHSAEVRNAADDQHSEVHDEEYERRHSKEYERTNQLTTDAVDDEGLRTPQAPTRDAETPSREQLEAGVLNPDLIDDRPTPEEWRASHADLDEELDEARDERIETRRDTRRAERRDDTHDDESIVDRVKHKFKGD